MKILERTFNLINSAGEVYSLSLTNSYSGFLYNVEGLGAEHAATYQKIGETYDLLNDDINQGEISGVIFFGSKRPYNEYMRFAQFCQEKPLKLYYKTPVDEYYRDGMVTKIEKNEGGETSRATIIFSATSLWYREVSAFVTSPSSPYTVEIISDSVIDCPCHLSATGMSISNGNLTWLQSVKRPGESDYSYSYVSDGKVSGVSIISAETFHLRTDTNPYKIYKELGPGGITNWYVNSDFSTPRFIFLKKGVNRFRISVAPSELKIEGRLLYETV